MALAGCGSAGAGSAGAGSARHPAGPTTSAAGKPSGEIPALGRVAVITSAGIEIVGGAGAVRVGDAEATSPEWSPDGRTLAFLDGQRLWLADPSGHSRTLLDRLIDSFAWSPAGNLLAAVPIPDGAPGGLVAVDTAGRVTVLVGPDFYVSSYQWSPDGRTIAYGQAFPAMSAGPADRTDRLYLRDLSSSSARVVPYDPGAGNGIILGAWWPNGAGIYLWPDPQHSASIAADGLELQAVSFSGGQATDIGTTLPHREALAVSPDGNRVVIMEGGSRFLTQTKSLVDCRVGGPRCSPVSQPTGTVSLEPSWAPDAKKIVFVRAAASQDVDTAPWLRTARLYLYDVASGEARPIPRLPTSVGYPEFSSDGRDVIFQHGVDLLTVNLSTGRVRRLATGLPPIYAQWVGTPPYALAEVRPRD
jgi:Tol biopolymer transport system component